MHPHDIIDGKYEVIRPIGEGGMSRVWLARDFYLDKAWAIKEVDKAAAGAEPLEVSCLVEEAQLLKKLEHPALPRVVEVLETADAVLLVMDYVQGRSLDEVLVERGGKVSEAEVVAWGLCLCEVLGYLHSQTPPVIYRDMKPSNVMLCDDGTLRLIDFGIARTECGNATGELSLGTKAYAAPEQLGCPGACDERSDLYALGKTLERLAGVDVARASKAQPSKQLSGELADVLRKATAREPEDRYQSAAEMAEALQRCRGALQQEQAKGVRTRVRAVAPLWGTWPARRRLVCVACVVLGCLWFIPWLYGAIHESATYAGLLQAAEHTSRQETEGKESEAERCYRMALELRPERSEPYEALLREVYLDDAQFSPEEAARWEQLAQAHAEALKGQERYPEICYEAGMLYYAFGEDGQQVQEAARGAWWFEACVQALKARPLGAMNSDLAMRAQAYGVICGFYRDVIVAREDARESDVYRAYWDALGQAVDSFDTKPSDALEQQRDGLVRLRLCELVRTALESPVHVAGFAQAGVTCDEVDALWAKALALSEQAQAAEGLSNTEKAGWKEVQEATSCVRASETAVYGVQ